MQIDHCLILAAGFGTRMGNIGKTLPKVLWPVFEKPLLELQVRYARSLGIKNIYINLHFMGEEIEAFAKDKEVFEGVTFLWEKPEILDIGGAIHNLAREKAVNYKGRLLVLNADQFFYLTKDDFSKILKPYENYAGVLLSYWVNSSLGYNALDVSSERLVKGITKNKDLAPDSRVETYTGISVIDLGKLDRIPGKSAFFDSVCPFDTKEIPAILLEKIDYWDFGTVQRFWETSFRLLTVYRTQSTHPFLRFLVTERALKTWKINLQELSYHSASRHVINLAPDALGSGFGARIVLGDKLPKDPGVSGRVYYQELADDVKL